MANQTEALWEINNEYRKQLTQLMGHLKLLEQLLQMKNHAEPGLRAAIRRMRVTLDEIDADHHDWRHTYFYQLSDDGNKRRMVNQAAAVQLALETFANMLGDHLQLYDQIAQTMAGLPHPDPALTRVIKGGDLWDMCYTGITNLAGYDRFMQEQLAV